MERTTRTQHSAFEIKLRRLLERAWAELNDSAEGGPFQVDLLYAGKVSLLDARSEHSLTKGKVGQRGHLNKVNAREVTML